SRRASSTPSSARCGAASSTGAPRCCRRRGLSSPPSHSSPRSPSPSRSTSAIVLARCSRRVLAGECKWLLLRHRRRRRSRWSRCLCHRNAGDNLL
ncbi:Os02g0737801, partial [Oryza sativa Japonica Group]